MKNYRTLLASLLLCSSASVMADTGVFIGVVYDFGGSNAKQGLGLSAKLVSSDEPDKVVGAIGFSYFPQATNKLGADISVGHTFDNGLVTLGYDVFNKQPQIGLGYMDTEEKEKKKAAPADPPPADNNGDGGSQQN